MFSANGAWQPALRTCHLEPDTGEDIIQMPQMIAEIEALFNLGSREVTTNLRVGQQELLEGLSRLPGLHGVPLDQPVGLFPAEALADQRQQDRLRKDQTPSQLQVLPHPFRIDLESLQDLAEADQQVV